MDDPFRTKVLPMSSPCRPPSRARPSRADTPTATGCTSSSSRVEPGAGSNGLSSAAGGVSSDSAASRWSPWRKLERRHGPTASWPARAETRSPRSAAHAGHAELRRSGRARGGTEAGWLAQSEAGARLDGEPEAPRLSVHRRDARLGGDERRRARDPHSDLAGKGDRRPGACASVSARCWNGPWRWSSGPTTHPIALGRS